jgi:hypothetical protein
VGIRHDVGKAPLRTQGSVLSLGFESKGAHLCCSPDRPNCCSAFPGLSIRRTLEFGIGQEGYSFVLLSALAELVLGVPGVLSLFESAELVLGVPGALSLSESAELVLGVPGGPGAR